jgi:very-short-patch-repair endonuclease
MPAPAKIRNFSRSLRKNPTDAEKKLWAHLRRKQISGRRFRRQHPLGRYIVDFVCLEAKLIVEIDGGQHAESVHDDTQRTQWLQRQGFRVARFWNNEVLGETESVLTEIARLVDSQVLPPPYPSPAGGGGDRTASQGGTGNASGGGDRNASQGGTGNASGGGAGNASQGGTGNARGVGDRNASQGGTGNARGGGDESAGRGGEGPCPL